MHTVRLKGELIHLLTVAQADEPTPMWSLVADTPESGWMEQRNRIFLSAVILNVCKNTRWFCFMKLTSCDISFE